MADKDPLVSQDAAFVPEEKKDETFKFDTELATPASQAETAKAETPPSSAGEEAVVDEEQRVPYSRFKRKVDELNETQSRISTLEQHLLELERQRLESQRPEEDVPMPKEWIELYGNSDVSGKAWKIQLQRENQLREDSVRTALQILKDEQIQEGVQVEENEEIIDENLGALSEAIGKKLTPKMEEQILSIVDEFSPTGDDGKYVSLFPFDKAYEIYELRQSRAGQGTQRARRTVADLTGNASEGEAETPDTNFKRGWDSWREAL